VQPIETSLLNQTANLYIVFGLPMNKPGNLLHVNKNGINFRVKHSKITQLFDITI